MSVTSDYETTTHPTVTAAGDHPAGHVPDPPRASVPEFKEFMRGFPSGVAVLATLDEEGRPIGMTCSALCSVGLDPPTLLACVGRLGRMRRAVDHTGSFTVNLLEGSGLQLARRFAAGHDRPFDGVPWSPSPNHHLPVPTEHVHRSAECRLHTSITVSDHTILIGEVIWVAECDSTAEPLLHGFSEFAMWRPGLAPRGRT
ncbi:MAG TPA: flavin reductase family protein [Actinophytocola sp.]|uniref:flavin reductase family protein n=1 Tax=Actinophytocola sp. TaxID=1872138 RepID=UPI002DBDE79D|nr:flavin reductase family protein [Actinophytocola sp.]HEU5473644.1 flavin reductase family protein [Actinophytocola sp.]